MPPNPHAIILGIAGPTLSTAEAALFARHPPASIILFRRNIESPAQLEALTTHLRAILPPGALLLVDQEGGRVARLRPPHWPSLPAAGVIGALPPEAAIRAAWLQGALIGTMSAQAGFNTVCAPVLDLRLPATTDAIGDRAFSPDPTITAQLGRALARGLLAAGIIPVAKHAPGHGRARVDSHFVLPVVDEPDLAPFAANADLPAMMTAHIIYRSLDRTLPATLSPTVIQTTIRQTIAFHGLLLSDDLAMEALTGDPATRATACLQAGCDIAVYCPGDFPSNEAILETAPPLTETALARLATAQRLAQTSKKALDPASLRAEQDRLLS